MTVMYRGKTSGDGASPLAFAHTCNALSNYLFVWVTGATVASGLITINSITYNGLALAQLETASAGDRCIHLWGRPNPPVGAAYNVVITHAGSYCYATACDWSGVKGSEPVVNKTKGYYSGDGGTPMVCNVEVASGENAAMEGTGGLYGHDNDLWVNTGAQTTIDSTGGNSYIKLCVGRYVVSKGTKTFKWEPNGAGGVTACYIGVEVNAGAGFLPTSLRILNGDMSFIKHGSPAFMKTLELYASPVVFTQPYQVNAWGWLNMTSEELAAYLAEGGQMSLKTGTGYMPKDDTPMLIRCQNETVVVQTTKGVVKDVKKSTGGVVIPGRRPGRYVE